MDAYVVCEGQTDAAIIGELLRPWSSSHSVKVVAENGRSPAIGYARTLASSMDVAVVLAMDSDATDEARTESIQGDLLSLLGQASGGKPYDVVMFVPEIEAVFFENASALARALKMPAIPKNVLLAAKYEPKDQLTHLLREAGLRPDAGALVALTKRIGINTLREHPAIQRLITFLQTSLSQLPALQAS